MTRIDVRMASPPSPAGSSPKQINIPGYVVAYSMGNSGDQESVTLGNISGETACILDSFSLAISPPVDLGAHFPVIER
jgi:hypothetical protein